MKKHLSVFLSLVLFVLLTINTTILDLSASEVTIDKIVLKDIKGTLSITLSTNTNYPLYYDEETPITYSWLKENPDYIFTVSTSYTGSWLPSLKFATGGLIFGNNKMVTSAGLTVSYQSFINHYGDEKYISYKNDNILLQTSSATTFSITPSGTIAGGDSGGTVTPDDGSGGTTEDDKGFFESLVNGVKEAFTAVGEFIVNGLTTVINGIVTAIEWLWDLLSSILNAILSAIEFVGEVISNAVTTVLDYISEKFQSLFDWFEYKKEEAEHKKSLWQVVSESLTDLIDKISHATLVPINNFLQSMKAGPIEVLTDIYEFPMIGELLLGAVAVLVVVGFFKLLTTV